jgi:hypothetical protein
LWLSNQN